MMQFVNPARLQPERVFHRSFFSKLAGHEVGYQIYLPAGYEEENRRWPLVCHLHGWQGNESSEIGAMEKVYRDGKAIYAFPNLYLPVDDPEHFPLEEMVLKEFIPHIEREYHAGGQRDARFLSGFSMGGGMAFVYAVKHPELFAGVTACAGTYHHYFDQGFLTVDADAGQAEQYRDLILTSEKVTENNILHRLNRQADAIRGTLKIELRVGMSDVLYCDNEIVHLHLDALNIPHTYVRIPWAAHELSKIV